MKKIDSSCSGDSVPNISKSCSSFSTRALKKQTENYINQPNNKEISTLAATTSRNGPEIVCRRRRAPACDFVVWLFFLLLLKKKPVCIYCFPSEAMERQTFFPLFFFFLPQVIRHWYMLVLFLPYFTSHPTFFNSAETVPVKEGTALMNCVGAVGRDIIMMSGLGS